MSDLPLIVFDVNETLLDLRTTEPTFKRIFGDKVDMQLCMLACHAWDTLGAVAAGWEAAFIRRPGNDILGVGPQPRSSATTSPM